MGFRMNKRCHRVVPRSTSFVLPPVLQHERERPPIQRVYAALAADEARNAMIFDDVLQALEDKRSPVILIERKDHALLLAERISRFARNVIVLIGGVGAKQRRAAMQRLGDVSATDERVLIATGRYIGEGFDDARLDTLFLAMPISWKGTVPAEWPMSVGTNGVSTCWRRLQTMALPAAGSRYRCKA